MSYDVRDTDTLIKQWRASSNRMEQIAADLTSKIAVGQLRRYGELPSQAVLAITRVKSLTLENKRYYIA
jgi:hypothetical protein